MKSILDIALTLETLETLHVPVLAYGTDEFPAFFSRSSGHQSPMRADTPAEVAAFMKAKWDLGIAGGVSLVNPIREEDEIPAAEMDCVIAQAIPDMDAAGVHGKEATPFLLGRIVEITGGASLKANIALVNNNARLGAPGRQGVRRPPALCLKTEGGGSADRRSGRSCRRSLRE